MPISRFFSLPAMAVLVAATAGCGSGDKILPLNAPAAANQPKPAESLASEQAPVARSQALTLKLNTYRAQTFGTPINVEHRNVLYTAASRHATYLNTVNSAQYTPNTGVSGLEGTAITANTSPLSALRGEPIQPATPTSLFPGPYTSPSLISRVQAVVGSQDLIENLSPGATFYEGYVFNGNILNNTGTQGISVFRGFNLDQLRDTDTTKYAFDEIDSLWYSRAGRVMLMRAAIRYVGYGSVYDQSGYDTIWPLFNGRLRGVVITASPTNIVAQRGYWPNDFNQDVTPYGLDTDIGGRNQYSGPPIHVTLPVAEPILTNVGGAASGLSRGITVGFRKLTTTPEGNPQSAPVPNIIRTLKLATNTGNGTVINAFPSTLGTESNYEYSFANSSLPQVNGFEMRDGEFFLIPTEPLEPNSWYEVGVRLRTASYAFEDRSDSATNPSSLVKWQFKTNGNTPPISY